MRFLLVLLLSVMTCQAQTIFSQGARNVKNGFAYGGASAKGDGVTDDTQAFLDALNAGRYRGANTSFAPVAIYVPPGTYLVKQSLLIWGNTFLFGEPSSPPTIVLAANSPNFSSGSNPFIVTVGGYNVPAYSTDWSTRTGSFNATTNNTFFIDVHDINFTVQSGNPGCSDVFLYACAQQTSLRNSVLTGDVVTPDCLRTDLTGGGGVIQGVTCSGAQVALQANDTCELLYRGCTFNGRVNLAGVL
jgi:Pectate lyase superfamily protein